LFLSFTNLLYKLSLQTQSAKSHRVDVDDCVDSVNDAEEGAVGDTAEAETRDETEEDETEEEAEDEAEDEADDDGMDDAADDSVLCGLVDARVSVVGGCKKLLFTKNRKDCKIKLCSVPISLNNNFFNKEVSGFGRNSLSGNFLRPP